MTAEAVASDVLSTGAPRTFVLRRYLDVSGVSGVSGEGDVAEGVQWSDGTVSLRWPGKHPSITFWQNGITSLEEVHGHGGATEVVFLGPEPSTGNPAGTPPVAAQSAARREGRR